MCGIGEDFNQVREMIHEKPQKKCDADERRDTSGEKSYSSARNGSILKHYVARALSLFKTHKKQLS